MAVNGEYTPSPRPHPRIKPEAAAFAERNRGNMERWFDYSENVNNYSSPRPEQRLRSGTARRIADNHKSKVNECMEGHLAPAIDRPIHPRGVKPEAQGIANSNKGKGMQDLMVNYGNMSIDTPPDPKVKGDAAQENLVRNKGVVDHIMNDYGNLTPEAPPRPKVNHGGSDVMENHKGKDMGPLLRMEGKKTPRPAKQGRLHKESEGGGWDETPPHIRTRPEAEAIVNKCTASSMGDIMKRENQPPSLRQPKILKHMMESESPRPRTSPARMRPEAMQHYQRNTQCEMAAIMRGEPAQSVSTPRRVNRMQQRSEDW